jgi:MFS family permease
MLARIERTPAWAVAAILAALYLVIDPPSADLAAQVYRSDYFGKEGLALWDNAWYAGHHMPGYSVLFPPLGSLLGPRVVGALSAVASAFLFERIADEHFHQAEGRPGVIWFAAATSLNLITGRLAFGLGVTVGLATILAITHRREALGIVLAVATTLASPVAGLFLAMGAAAWWLAARSNRAIVLATAALIPAAFLSFAFPEGGPEPFVASSFWPTLVTIAFLLAALPPEERELRIGSALYALATIAAYVIASPMGGNVTRLGALFGGPLLACLVWRRRPLILAALALPLLYWQWNAPVRDWVRAHGDPSIHASYYRPLLGYLDANAGGAPFRIEIPFTANHWESARVAPHYPLARGWERQLDRRYNELFYEDELDPARYRRWLDDNAVRYVALSDARLDGSAKQEDALVRSGRVPWLKPVWSGPHWRVFAVDRAMPLAAGAATVTRLGPDSVDLTAERAGDVRLRVHFTAYWALVRGSGCVERDGAWTRIRVRRPGPLRLATRFEVGRIVSRGPRCTR